MKIIISGKSGYLGKLISKELEKKNFKVAGISRAELYGSVELLAERIEGSDVIINLVGAPILQRWTNKNKKIIYDSRVITTQNLVSAILQLPDQLKPHKFITISAIGIYKSGSIHSELSTNYDNGFIGNVVKDWEKPLEKLPESIQKVIFRTGIVLGENSKTITNLLLPFKLGLGATIGNGKQPFPFVHEQDVVQAFAWATEELKESGIFNLTAPERINNKAFTKELASQLHRPAFFVIPRIFLIIMYGNAASIIAESPEISSEKIVKAGFKFNYPDIASALKQII